MTKDEFSQLFQQALETAAQNAERVLQRQIPRQFAILFHGASHSGQVYSGQQLTVETALESLYLGADRMYRIIDVVVQEIDGDLTKVFVRPSGHPPVTSLEETWNQPSGMGPFKQIMALKIKVTEPNQV